VTKKQRVNVHHGDLTELSEDKLLIFYEKPPFLIDFEIEALDTTNKGQMRQKQIREQMENDDNDNNTNDNNNDNKTNLLTFRAFEKGTIIKVHNDRTFDVKFIHGDIRYNVPEREIRLAYHSNYMKKQQNTDNTKDNTSNDGENANNDNNDKDNIKRQSLKEIQRKADLCKKIGKIADEYDIIPALNDEYFQFLNVKAKIETQQKLESQLKLRQNIYNESAETRKLIAQQQIDKHRLLEGKSNVVSSKILKNYNKGVYYDNDVDDDNNNNTNKRKILTESKKKNVFVNQMKNIET